jgi:hypothetical protein
LVSKSKQHWIFLQGTNDFQSMMGLEDLLSTGFDLQELFLAFLKFVHMLDEVSSSPISYT